MSAIPAEQFAEILRVVRETVREEMRAEFEARREPKVDVPMIDVLVLDDGYVRLEGKEWAQIRSRIPLTDPIRLEKEARAFVARHPELPRIP